MVFQHQTPLNISKTGIFFSFAYLMVGGSGKPGNDTLVVNVCSMLIYSLHVHMGSRYHMNSSIDSGSDCQSLGCGFDPLFGQLRSL